MLLSRLFIAVFAVIAFAVPLTPAAAHEYWIEPQAYQVQSGDSIQAHFKNGQNFEGITLSYFDRSSTRFDQMFNGITAPVAARAGDSPALQLAPMNEDGLLVVVHETAPSKLTYSEWAKFLKFAEHKDFADAAATHIENGWSQEKFRESYTRHVKTLIAVGNGAGEDAAQGLATEFVALTNPYVDGFDGQMSVALTYDGKPRADAQIEVFDRAPDDAVTVTMYRTDAQGEANIPVTPGHAYLFDAVVLRPAAADADDPNAPVWETLWAALTFAVPK